MAKHNIKEAARLAGVDRATLYRAMADGKISFETLPSGRRVIDTAELTRVYGELRHETTRDMPQDGAKRHNAMGEMSHENSMLRQQIEILQQHVAAAEADKVDLRHRLDASEEERRQVLKLLSDQRRPVSRWRRWFGY